MRYQFIQRSSLIFTIAILLGFAAPVSADEIEAPKSVAEELLEILRAAGTIGETQYLELRDRARAEDEQRIKAAVEEAVEHATKAAELAAVSAAPTTEPDPRAGSSNGTTASSSGATMEPSSSTLAAVSTATGR